MEEPATFSVEKNSLYVLGPASPRLSVIAKQQPTDDDHRSHRIFFFK